ncbi:MAG: hypothetical protein IJ682_09720 [Lachnospiraceae bacterium]|nr:hypothetical protein [Lachnospiraceae bacterium]
MRAMKRTMVALTLIFGMVASFTLCEIKNVYADGIADEAIYYELGEICRGKTLEWMTAMTSRYYEMPLDKKAKILMKVNCEGSDGGSWPAIKMRVYDEKGKLAVEESAFDYKYNKVKGRYNAKTERVLKKGTYYIEIFQRMENKHYNFTFSKTK